SDEAISSRSAAAGAASIRHRRMLSLSRATEQLARVRDGARGDLLAAEHPRDLRDARLVILELANARARVRGDVFFPDIKVCRAEARDLRQMRDADDLVPRGEVLQFAADDFGDAAADAGVDLVEYERRR